MAESLLLLLLRRLLLLEGLLACLAIAESAGKCLLRSELSTRLPTLINDAKLVTGWMDSRVAVAGCAPLLIMLIDSSSEGLPLIWAAMERQRLTYSPNGSWGLCWMATRSSYLGIKSRLKEY